MPANLLRIVESTTLDAEQSSASTAQIHAVVLTKSKYIDVPNFTKIHPADLELLFAEYDHEFFDGQHRFEHWYRDNTVYFITTKVRDGYRAFDSDRAKRFSSSDSSTTRSFTGSLPGS